MQTAEAAMGDQILVGLVTDAITLTAQRVARTASEHARKSRRRTDISELIRVDVSNFVPSLASVAAFEHLTIDAATVRAAFNQPRGRTLVSQIVAAVVIGEYEQHEESICLLAKDLLGATTGGCSDTEARALTSAIHQLATDAAGNTVSTPVTAAIADYGSRTLLLQSAVRSIQRDLHTLREPVERNAERDESWIAKYRNQCLRRHGIITPPDYNKRTPVPLHDIYVPGRIAPEGERTSMTVYEAIPHLDRAVILGTPGGGKSTLTNAVAERLAQGDGQRLPLVVVLRDFGHRVRTDSIAEYIERSLSSRYEIEPPPSGLVETVLRQGRAFVLLDGLDELLDPTLRKAMAEKVELFAELYPTVPIIVTSRKVGYAEAALDRTMFESFELASYSKGDVAEYVQKWFDLNASELTLEDGATTADVCTAFLSESATIEDLRSNPLLLALLCIIYRGQNYLPKNRIGIYEKCAELLFETWDRSRGLTYDFQFDAYIEAALKHLAHWMFTNDEGGVGVTESVLVEEIARFFAEEAYESETKAQAAAKEFIGFCKGRAWVLTEVGLSAFDEPLFSFVHRTFLEYYAAAQVTRLNPEPEKLALVLVKHVAKNEWDTVGQLAVQLMNRSVVKGAEKALMRMMQSSHARNRSFEYRANTLMFVVRCLRDLPQSPGLMRAVFPKLAAVVAQDADSDVDEVLAGYSLRQLYLLDQTGEFVLLSELSDFVDQNLWDGERGWNAAFSVVTACLRAPLKPHEIEFFRKVFIDDWAEQPAVRYNTLTSAYYNGSIDVPEMVAMVTNAGGSALDFLLYNPGPASANSLAAQDYQCLAIAIAVFPRLFSDRQAVQFDQERGRWLGSLVTDVGEYLRSSSGPLFSRGLLADRVALRYWHLNENDLRALGGVQLLCVLMVSAALVEYVGGPLEQDSAAFALPTLEEAVDARNSGCWPAGGEFARLDVESKNSRWQHWARRGGSGLVG
ncbi:NACHT domain-containing protein [Curtobacterium flaccumfaciens]|uniref:NACHT domain-containing protein n=1 Tax=Curtobacterium flaccumfaciens TaxID=2035 RepID=UPI00217F158D|nr:NACHT domain-containing protein [Curtobacterium flaccumfaciens]MCS6560160.1 NACHT domain-containing protein [Curtobacterium flaccumfaciens]